MLPCAPQSHLYASSYQIIFGEKVVLSGPQYNMAKTENSSRALGRRRHRPMPALSPPASASPKRHGVELGRHSRASRSRAVDPRARSPCSSTLRGLRDERNTLRRTWGSQFLQWQQSDLWRALQIIFVVNATSQIIHQRRTGVPRLHAVHHLVRQSRKQRRGNRCTCPARARPRRLRRWA